MSRPRMTGLPHSKLQPRFIPSLWYSISVYPKLMATKLLAGSERSPQWRVLSSFIIALSGYGAEQDRGRAYEAGFNYHLTKPIAPATPFELLSRTLEPPS